MDFHLKQWRNQQADESENQEEEHQQPVKMPKLLLDNINNHSHYSSSASSLTSSPSSLSLFVPEIPSCKISHLSAAFSDSTQLPPANTSRPFPKMGYFSWQQRQELELQALIYKYMLAGATVPPELLQPIKKSVLHSPPYFLHHPLQHYSYYQPALLQTGYWGRGAMDPEPGRCRRTDGKKWRCSRDVVVGQKYCERHVHRGRNRSRKPVEIPTPTAATNTTIGGGGGGGGDAFTSSSILAPPLGNVVVNNGNNNNNNNNSTYSFTGQSSSSPFLHHNNGPSEIQFGGSLLGGGHRSETADDRDGRILRHFFDDWPRSESDSHHGGNSGGGNGQMNTATCLSISMPGNMTSDVSLKLATGDVEEPEGGQRGNQRDVQMQPQLNWNGGWGAAHVASMGGPLAEALGSSTSNSSPTSVLHHLARASASETSFISA
ncbi:growth-regulating factor 3 [Euphorbia peplus]|nr:growth-regulating factor 3 [Euphorbia peplus]